VINQLRTAKTLSKFNACNCSKTEEKVRSKKCIKPTYLLVVLISAANWRPRSGWCNVL